MSHASRLRDWLDSFIKQNSPGTPLPFDRKLAETFSLSTATVKRTLKPFVQQGKLVRVQGKGTFVSAGNGIIPQPPQLLSAEQEIIQALYDGIADGTFKQGRPLPMNKLLCLQFNVSPRTVTAAYRRLVETGLVTKIGKQFVVGSFSSIVSRHTRKQALLFFDPLYGPEKIFNESRIALNMRKMESELQEHGYLLTLVPCDEFSNRVHEWISADRLPDGIILCGHRDGGVEIAGLEHSYPAFEHLYSRSRQSPPKVLCIAVGRPKKHYTGMSILNIGHIDIVRARTMANYLVRRKHREAVIFFDESEWDRRINYHSLRLVPEIKRFQPEFTVHIVIRTDQAYLSRKQLLQRLYEKTPPNIISRHISRYTPFPATVVTDRIRWCRSFQHEFGPAVCSGTWIFGEDRFALEALTWCRRNGIPVPHDISILAYKESPACLLHGISVCTQDWETTGYIMAHSLIDDIPIARSRHGYIVTKARILERHTTR